MQNFFVEDKCTHVPTSLTHGSKPSSMLNDIVPPGVKGACNSIVQVTTGLSNVISLIWKHWKVNLVLFPNFSLYNSEFIWACPPLKIVFKEKQKWSFRKSHGFFRQIWTICSAIKYNNYLQILMLIWNIKTSSKIHLAILNA